MTASADLLPPLPIWPSPILEDLPLNHSIWNPTPFAFNLRGDLPLEIPSSLALAAPALKIQPPSLALPL
jgi:hypothetical protein